MASPLRMTTGDRLEPSELAAAVYDRGWHDAVSLHRMVAVILAVSDGYPGAVSWSASPLWSLRPGQVARERVDSAPFEVANISSGVIRDLDTGKPRQVSASALLVTERRYGLGGLLVPIGEEPEPHLLTAEGNLRAARRLFAAKRFHAWPLPHKAALAEAAGAVAGMLLRPR